jgi:CDP-6-deoxy-D-xylo-4-hexulose-3-dehydrase
MRARADGAAATAAASAEFRVVGPLRATDTVMNDALWVGVYPGLDDAMLEHIAGTLLDAAESPA